MLDELEITFLSFSEGIELFMQIDTRVRGFRSFIKDSASLDEKHIKLRISQNDLEKRTNYVAKILESIIKFYILEHTNKG